MVGRVEICVGTKLTPETICRREGHCKHRKDMGDPCWEDKYP